MAEVGRILFLPGDGIGPEVMAEVRRVIGWLGRRGLEFEVEEDLVGGAAYNAHGTPLADQPKLPPMECLKIVAIARFVLPTAELKVAGGREVCYLRTDVWSNAANLDITRLAHELTLARV